MLFLIGMLSSMLNINLQWYFNIKKSLLQNASKITLASTFSRFRDIPSVIPWERYSTQTINTWNIEMWRVILILEFLTSEECKFEDQVSNCVFSVPFCFVQAISVINSRQIKMIISDIASHLFYSRCFTKAIKINGLFLEFGPKDCLNR